MPKKSKKKEQAEKTQRALLDIATQLFTERGYAKTSTEEIVRRAQVTRGALYYHYRDKAALFEAVFEEVRAASMRTIQKRVQAAEGDLWQRVVVKGCQAFVEVVVDPSMQRIVYIEGPAVLDWVAIQEYAPGMQLMRETCEHLMRAGLIEQMPLEPLARALWGTFFEAGVYVSQANDMAVAQEEMARTLIRLLSGLRPPRAPQQRGRPGGVARHQGREH